MHSKNEIVKVDGNKSTKTLPDAKVTKYLVTYCDVFSILYFSNQIEARITFILI